MKRFAYFITFIFLASLAGGIAVASPREPGAFIEYLGKRAINLLHDKSASEEDQRKGFRALLREGFATRAIGYFVIGRYRRSSSRAEVNDFVATFENYIVELYSSQFRNYSGQKFKVAKVQRTSRPTDFIVKTHILRANGEPIFTVGFQVRTRTGMPSKILDVKIKGVSMILAQRDEFTAFISRHDGKIKALVDVLKKRIKDLKTKRIHSEGSTAEPEVNNEKPNNERDTF